MSMAVVTKSATRTAVLERPKVKPDGYARAFARARAYLEAWMRGQPLDVDGFAAALRPLPDTVCKTLVRGLPKETCAEVSRKLTLLRAR